MTTHGFSSRNGILALLVLKRQKPRIRPLLRGEQPSDATCQTERERDRDTQLSLMHRCAVPPLKDVNMHPNIVMFVCVCVCVCVCLMEGFKYLSIIINSCIHHYQTHLVWYI